MTFPGGASLAGEQPLLAPTSSLCLFLHPALTASSVPLGRAAVWLSLQRAGRERLGECKCGLIYMCAAAPALSPLEGNKGKFWAPQAAPGPSGQVDSVISATAVLSSNTSGFSIAMSANRYHLTSLPVTLDHCHHHVVQGRNTKAQKVNRLARGHWLIGGGEEIRTHAVGLQDLKFIVLVSIASGCK